MVELHLTLRGEVGGKRAEVRLEPGHVRVQVLAIVTQQPAVDATFALRDLTDFRLLRRVQWTYVAVAIVVGALMSTHLPGSIRELGLAGVAVYVLMLPTGFALVAWLLPRNLLRIATQDSYAEVDVSTFSRARAQDLISAVRQVRPDLPA
jgi:hypothetical protein